MNSTVQNVTFSHFDETMEFGLGSDDSIYRYDDSTGGYELFYNFTQALPSGMDINVHQDRLVLNGTSATSAWVEAYQVSADGTIHESFLYEYTNFTETPSIEISPKLNRVTISGLTDLGDGLKPHLSLIHI